MVLALHNHLAVTENFQMKGSDDSLRSTVCLRFQGHLHHPAATGTFQMKGYDDRPHLRSALLGLSSC